MNQHPEKMRDRGRSLNPDERRDLRTFIERSDGLSRAAAATGCAESTVIKWLQGRPIERKRLGSLLNLLGIAPPLATTNLQGTSNAPSPMELMDQWYNAAREAHFQRFDPLAASRHLMRMVACPSAIQAEADWLVERLCTCIAILRQSAFTGLGQVAAAAELCIERLSCIGYDDKSERLAALAAAMASELAGLVIQRGDAPQGALMLDIVFNVLQSFNLNESLPTGKLRAMYRMRQWAWEVSNPDLQQARTEYGGNHSLITKIVELESNLTTEAFSTRHQKLVALNRQALAMAHGADEDLVEFFERHYRAPFKELTDAVKNQGLDSSTNFVTPTTAMAIALNVTLMAAHLNRAGDDELIHRAALLHNVIKRAAKGGVLLQRANPETLKAAAALARGPWQDISPHFEFTAQFGTSATPILLNYARQIVDLVPNCLKRSIAV